jgi:hypothetical protein
MSKTDRASEVSGGRTDRPGSEERASRRLQSLYRADLRPFEPVSDVQILAAIYRAEVHDKHDHASRSDVAAHLGFVHNSWTTRRLRPQLDALRSTGSVRDVRRYGLDLLALTDAGRRALAQARSTGEVVLPESPQHRRWRHSRTLAGERIDGFRQALRASLAEAGALLDAAHAPSTNWVEFASRLSRDCKRLGSATYCLFEWPEPDDERADVDDEIKGRRNVWDWDSDYYGY